ncbi:hypothetical protein [Heyndrickxia sporothermodurans]|uniref:hypothetical protein n=1 Tax=Heyndrickxia sporothermodurans TaxID=46224 RepID=UPI0035E00351
MTGWGQFTEWIEHLGTGSMVTLDIATQKSQLCVKRHHLVRLLIPIIATRLPQHT